MLKKIKKSRSLLLAGLMLVNLAVFSWNAQAAMGTAELCKRSNCETNGTGCLVAWWY